VAEWRVPMLRSNRELPIVDSFISAFNSTAREATSAGRTASGKEVNCQLCSEDNTGVSYLSC